jgi:hypothetical protein
METLMSTNGLSVLHPATALDIAAAADAARRDQQAMREYLDPELAANPNLLRPHTFGERTEEAAGIAESPELDRLKHLVASLTPAARFEQRVSTRAVFGRFVGKGQMGLRRSRHG